MKPKFALPLICLLAFGLLNQSASAALVLTVSNENFTPIAGVQSINVFVRSNAADTSLFLTADFQLSAGVFPTTAGVFGQAGMVGEGNIQDPPISQFVSAGDNSATLSLDFTGPQLFPATNTLLATMFVDTTGLAPGTYGIQVTSFSSQFGGSAVNGSFTISAVPEPSSICLVALMAVFALGRRKSLSTQVLAAARVSVPIKTELNYFTSKSF